MSKKTYAIVLAAGQGKRMQQKVHKQYLLLKDKPVLYYSLKCFQESSIDEIILVTGPDEIEYCHEKIVNQYGFTKVSSIVSGGKERYHSVYAGLQTIKDSGYVLIHDGARPFITEEIIRRNLEEVEVSGACVTAVPSKDTVKIADSNNYIEETPDRDKVWIIQTPQTFSVESIRSAYEVILTREHAQITDDAMVMEAVSGAPIRLVMGDYRNIKITTPEDLIVGEAFLEKNEN